MKPPKSKTTITKKSLPKTSTPKFFQLPRELRDQIYAYLLVSPPLYDRRHKSGCHFHNRDEACERPPILTYGDRLEDEVLRCRNLCAWRENLAVLRVNRQVYEEAAEVLYGWNTVVFTGVGDAVRRLDMLEDDGGVMGRMKRMAIWDVESVSGGYEIWLHIGRLLLSLTRLEHLEIVVEDVNDIGDVIYDLPCLKTLRIWQLDSVKYVSDDGSRFVRVQIGFFRQWDDPQEKVKEIEGVVQQWIDREQADVREPITKKLSKLQPAKEGDGPYLLDVDFPGDETERVHVWGLALETPAVRVERQQAAAKKQMEGGRRKGVLGRSTA